MPARRADRQAFSANNGYWSVRNGSLAHLRVRRPAYRPKETVNWKFIAAANGPVYATPSGQKVEFEILDPRGTKVKADKATLNSSAAPGGSNHGTNAARRIPCATNEGHSRSIGSATLFRLEEYKLPEFKVTVQTPEEDGANPSGSAKSRGHDQAGYYGPVLTRCRISSTRIPALVA